MNLNELVTLPEDSEHRPDAIREALVKLRQVKDLTNVALGHLLYEVREKEYYKQWTYEEDGETKNFTSVEQYAFIEHNYDRTSTSTFIRIYETFVLKLGQPEERINSVGWGKLKMLLPRVDQDNVDEMLDIAEQNTQTKLKEIIHDADEESAKPKSSSDEEDVKWVKHKFALTEGQHQLLEKTFTIIEKVHGIESDSGKLEFLCATMLTSDNVEEYNQSLKANIGFIERAFGVKLQIVEE